MFLRFILFAAPCWKSDTVNFGGGGGVSGRIPRTTGAMDRAHGRVSLNISAQICAFSAGHYFLKWLGLTECHHVVKGLSLFALRPTKVLSKSPQQQPSRVGLK